MDEPVYEVRRYALDRAVECREPDATPEQVVAAAEVFYKFLTSPPEKVRAVANTIFPTDRF